MAETAPPLIVLGFFTLMWGSFRMLWDTPRDRIAGAVLFLIAVTSLSAGFFAIAQLMHRT